MGSYLSFGNWNRNYIYIFLSSIFLNLYKVIVSYNYYSYEFSILEILGSDDTKEVTGHLFIHQFLYYFIIFVFAIIHQIYKKKRYRKEKLGKRKKQNESKNKDEGSDEILIITKQDLIYNNIYEYGIDNNQISYCFSLIIIFFYVIAEQAHIVFKRFFVNCDFWMLELIIMAFLNKRMFKIEIYKHQYFSLFLVAIPSILKIITIFLLFQDKKNYFNNGTENYKYDETDPNNNELKALFVAKFYLLFVAIIIYILIMLLKSYVIITIKKIMDLKYVSLTKILIIYGGFGWSLLLFISVISSFYTCGERNENSYSISDYQCKVIDKSKNETYLEKIDLLITQGTIWINFLIPFFGGLAFGLYKLFVLSIVQYLTPIHKSFSLPIYYYFQKLILIYKVIIKYIENQSDYKANLYWIDLSSDLAAVFAF